MKIQSIIIAFLSFFILNLNAQEIEWQKSLGGSGWEEAFSIQQANDGGYIAVGYTGSNDGNVNGNHGFDDYWVVKLDANGNLVWQKCYGGIVSDRGMFISPTSDGGFIATGNTDSWDGDVYGNHGARDIWVVKHDTDGNLEWQKCLGGSDGDAGHSIQQTNDGGFIVAGVTDSNDGNVSGNHGELDYWVAKLDANGNLVWQKCLGGSDSDYGRSVQQTNDGGYIVAGGTTSNDGDVTGNHGSTDFWVVKLDHNGILVWQKCLGGSAGDFAQSVQQTNDGGYIITGYSSSEDGDISGNHGSTDYWVVKLDSDGNLLWQKSLGGSSSDVATSILQTADNGYIVSGYSSSNDGDVSGNHSSTDYWIVKLDPDGNLLWQKSFGGTGRDQANSIGQTNDEGYILAGWSDSNDGDVSENHGARDYWIVKLAPVTTAITDPSNELNVQFYPNPTSDILFIESEKELTDLFVTISTMDVKLLSQNNYGSSNQISVNVSSLPTGVYLLEVRSILNGEPTYVTTKFFIE